MNKIFIEHVKSNREALHLKHPNSVIFDVTSSSDNYKVLSPFYPIGNIPVPFSRSYKSQTVEGIWQGLKVFDYESIDTEKFEITSMRGLKRYGKPLGHLKGVFGDPTELLDYVTARKELYVPSYYWVLDNNYFAKEIINQIRLTLYESDVILLDWNLNSDIEDTTSPLSHASLIKSYILGDNNG